jgi:hypothetical protein
MNKLLAFTSAFLLLTSVANAGSGNAVLHGSSTANGPNHPDCGWFYTAVPGTASTPATGRYGVGSDDGIVYGVDLTTAGGAANWGNISASDLSQAPIVFQISPCAAVTPGICGDNVVIVCKVSWE